MRSNFGGLVVSCFAVQQWRLRSALFLVLALSGIGNLKT